MWCQFWVSLRLVLVSVLNDLDHSLMGHVAWRKPGAMLWGSPKERLTWWGSSVQFSYSVVSNSLWPHGLQHTRTPCLSPTPGIYSNSCSGVSDAIQPSHPVVPFSSCLQSSQHQGLFKWVSSLHQVAKVLEFQLQHQSFQRTFRTDFLLGCIGWISVLSKGLSRVFSNTTVQKHQFFGSQLFL